MGAEPAKASPNQKKYNVTGPEIESIVAAGLFQQGWPEVADLLCQKQKTTHRVYQSSLVGATSPGSCGFHGPYQEATHSLEQPGLPTVVVVCPLLEAH